MPFPFKAAQLSAGPSVPSSSLLTSLAVYYKLDEASGTRFDSVNSLEMTAVDEAVSGVAGKIGNGATFTAATTTFLRAVATNNAYVCGDIDFTIRAWINITAKPANQAFVAKDTSGAREYILWHDSALDRFTLAVCNGSSPVGTVRANVLGSPALSTWYYVLAWHDSVNNQVGISVNNGTATTAATTGAVGTTTSLFSVGARNFSGQNLYCSAIVDEVALWKRLLTSDEKATDYNGGTGKTHPWSS